MNNKKFSPVKQNLNAKGEFSLLFERMYEICEKNNWGDPFSYARSREIHMANLLGHRVAPTISGANAFNQNGECEYKTTIGKSISATYNGISVQDTWDKQIAYLKKEKIGRYKNHYFGRYEGAKIVEIYVMSNTKVLEFLIPRLQKQFNNSKKRKDPRLGSTINKTYIIANSTKIV